MEERETSSKIGLKYFMRFSSDLKVFDYLYRDHCENYKWYNKAMYNCRDHGKSLCTIWFFVIHSKCWWVFRKKWTPFLRGRGFIFKIFKIFFPKKKPPPPSKWSKEIFLESFFLESFFYENFFYYFFIIFLNE